MCVTEMKTKQEAQSQPVYAHSATSYQEQVRDSKQINILFEITAVSHYNFTVSFLQSYKN